MHLSVNRNRRAKTMAKIAKCWPKIIIPTFFYPQKGTLFFYLHKNGYEMALFLYFYEAKYRLWTKCIEESFVLSRTLQMFTGKRQIN